MINRYLFPWMLNTTQLPTWLADAKSAFTSVQFFQSTRRLFTWVNQARSGRSESLQPTVSQNADSRDLEMTRNEWHLHEIGR